MAAVVLCCGEHVHTCTYISGSRCAWWQKTMNRQTHTHTYTHGTTTVPHGYVTGSHISAAAAVKTTINDFPVV